jgi:hypothetical protein
MPMRRNKRSRYLTKIAALASEADQLMPHMRGYVLAIQWFSLQTDQYRNLFRDLATFQSIVEYLDAVQETLHEAVEWIEKYGGDLEEFATLSDFLRDDAASGLESQLDAMQDFVPGGSPLSTDSTHKVMADVETLGERVHDDIRNKGYELHGVLIGAAFYDEKDGSIK